MQIEQKSRNYLSPLLYFMLTALLLFCWNPTHVYAEETDRMSDEEYVTAQNWPEAPEIGAEAAVLIEADSGTVLYAKNADSKRYPASITKILTALVTIENSDLSDTLVFEGEALDPLPDGYVSIHPTAGEKMSVEDCLYGLLLESANDAANALAVHDSGTIAEFAVKMNAQAIKAGAKHTHFTNPSGLADENHYTTPYDMAMIMRACIQHEEFLEIAGNTVYTIPATNTSAARTVSMRHEMLKKNTSNYYEYCVAGKTGFTTPSGYTLITYAEKDGMKLICCVMQCAKGVQYQSTRALFEYGFHSFQMVSEEDAASEQTVMNTGIFVLDQIQKERNLPFTLEKVDASGIILPEGCAVEDLEASVQLLNPEEEADDCFAEVTYLWEGMQLGTARLRMTPVNTSSAQESDDAAAFIGTASGQNAAMMFAGCLLGIVLVLLIGAILAVRTVKKYKKEQQEMNSKDEEMKTCPEQNLEETEPIESVKQTETTEQIEQIEQTEQSENTKEVPMVSETTAAASGIDFAHAKDAFERYLDGYDREDDRIRLKIVHTYCVVDCCKEIALRMGLSQEDTDLAMLIGLLHDIGRFEQVKRYQSFEPATMDHAAEGVRILFEEGMIRQFLETGQYDEIIRTAIAKHSDFELKGIEEERTLLHARLIRDADKLDNCRVKLEDAVEVLLNKTAEEAGKEDITDKIFQTACEKKSIFSPDRKTAMDYWVSYIVYIYDMNFKETLEIVKEKNYMSAIIHRIPYANQDTSEKMARIEADVLAYLEEKTK